MVWWLNPPVNLNGGWVQEVSKHSTNSPLSFNPQSSALLKIKVLDVTKFLEEHPGGEEVLIEYSGTDATKAFEDIGHSKAANSLLLKYKVGHLPGFNFPSTEFASDEPFPKEMKAFVIKEDPKLSLFLLGNLTLLFAYKFMLICCHSVADITKHYSIMTFF